MNSNEPTPLIVIGAGGFGREILDVVQAVNAVGTPTFDLLGVLDDGPSESDLARLAARGISYLGAIDEWKQNRTDFLYVIGIGSPTARKMIDTKVSAWGWEAASLVHPLASVGSECSIGPGALIVGGVHVTTNVSLGRHVHLNLNVTVGHDSVLEDYVTVNPGVAVSGSCCIESGVMLGSKSVVLQGLTVGAGATVGAAACVVRNVPPGVVVKGIPAR